MSDVKRHSKFSELLKHNYDEVFNAFNIATNNKRVSTELEAKYELYKLLNDKLLKDETSQADLDKAIQTSGPLIGTVDCLMRLVYFGLLVSLERKDEFQFLMEYRKSQRVSALIHNTELTPHDLEMISKIAKSISDCNHRKDHNQFLDLCVKNVRNWFANPETLILGKPTFAKLKKQLLQIDTSRFSNESVMNPQIQFSRFSCVSSSIRDGKFNRSLKDLIDKKEIVVSEEVFCGALKENRLSTDARMIIRGIIMRLTEVHDAHCAYGELSSQNVLLNSEYEVKLKEFVRKPGTRRSIKQDFRALKGVIVNFMSISDLDVPKDLIHLMNLLDNTIDVNSRSPICYHSCLWTPHEVIKNIFLFALLEDKGIIHLEWHVRDSLDEITRDWKQIIPGNSIYHNLLTDQVHYRKYRGYGVVAILLYMKNALAHAHNHEPGQCELVTEKDLFVMFVNFLPCLVQVTTTLPELQDIYKAIRS